MVLVTRFSVDKQLKTNLKMASDSFRTASKEKCVALEKKMFQVATLLRESPPKMEKAKIRTELIIHEENLIEAYEILRLDCELLVDSIQLIKNSPSCPADLLLHVSRLLYASNRISSNDVPGLSDIRDQFLVKYGQKCIDSVEKNIPNSKVHQRIVSKLSIDPPPEETLINTHLNRICDKFKVNEYPQQSNIDRNIGKVNPMPMPIAHPISKEKVGFGGPVRACNATSSLPLTPLSYNQTSESEEYLRNIHRNSIPTPSVSDDSGLDESVWNESSTDESSMDESSTEESSTDESLSDESFSDESSTDESFFDESYMEG